MQACAHDGAIGVASALRFWRFYFLLHIHSCLGCSCYVLFCSLIVRFVIKENHRNAMTNHVAPAHSAIDPLIEGDHHGGRRAGAFAALGHGMQQHWIAVKGYARECCMRMSRGSGVDRALDVEGPDPVKTLRCVCWHGKRQLCRPTLHVRSSHVLVASRLPNR